MKSVRWALLAAVVGLGLGGADTSEAAIFDYSYKFDSSGSTFQALFDGAFRPDNNIFDITGVNSVTVNGAAFNDTFFLSTVNASTTTFVSRDGTAQSFAVLNSDFSQYFLAEVSSNVGLVGATPSFGAAYNNEPYNPANFNGRAAGPGAPAPEIGVGLLSVLAAGLALAFTRLRRPAAMLPA